MCLLCGCEGASDTIDADDDVDGEVVSNVDAEERGGDADGVPEEPADDPLNDEGQHDSHECLEGIFLLRRLARVKEGKVVPLVHEGDANEERAQANDEDHEGLLPLWAHVLQADAAEDHEAAEHNEEGVQVEDHAAVSVLHFDVD